MKRQYEWAVYKDSMRPKRKWHWDAVMKVTEDFQQGSFTIGHGYARTRFGARHLARKKVRNFRATVSSQKTLKVVVEAVD